MLTTEPHDRSTVTYVDSHLLKILINAVLSYSSVSQSFPVVPFRLAMLLFHGARGLQVNPLPVNCIRQYSLLIYSQRQCVLSITDDAHLVSDLFYCSSLLKSYGYFQELTNLISAIYIHNFINTHPMTVPVSL